MALDESCENVVRGAWDSIVGDLFSSRISFMAHDLVSWSVDKFVKLGKHIEKIEKKLVLAQQRPVTDASCEEYAELEKLMICTTNLLVPSLSSLYNEGC